MSFPSPSPRQARIIWNSLTFLAIGVLVALLGLLGYGVLKLLSFLSPVLWPIALAAIIAYLLDPLVTLLQKRLSRTQAILAVFAGVAGVAVLAALSVTPRIVHEISSFDPQQFQARVMDVVHKSGDFRKRTAATVAQFSPRLAASIDPDTHAAPPPGGAPPAAVKPDHKNWEARMAGDAARWLGVWLPKAGAWLVSQLGLVTSLLSLLAGLGLAPVYCYYFLQEKRGIQQGWQDCLPIPPSAPWRKEVIFVLTSINDYLITFFRGQMIVALCNSVLYVIGFSVIGLNFSVVLGLAAGALSVVPFLGVILTLVPALILAAVQFGDWYHPLLVGGIFACVQLTESLVISPKIMGDRVGLHPLAIIIAVMTGTVLMGGILGGVLAIPLTAALRVIMYRYIWTAPR